VNHVRYYLALVGKNYNTGVTIVAAPSPLFLCWVGLLSITNKTSAPEALKTVEKQWQTVWCCSTK